MKALRLWLPAASAVVLLSACSGTPASRCDSTNCAGCCDSAGVCQPGTESLACGQSGALCNTCSAGLRCSLGFCVPGGTGGGTGGGVGGGAGGGAGGGLGGGGGDDAGLGGGA
ncbi:MAG: hypothetical protein AB1938_31035, partial [Myxococcota bacterium]